MARKEAKSSVVQLSHPEEFRSLIWDVKSLLLLLSEHAVCDVERREQEVSLCTGYVFIK